PCEALHRRRIQPVRVRKNRQRIASKGLIGEYVKLIEMILGHGQNILSSSRLRVSWAYNYRRAFSNFVDTRMLTKGMLVMSGILDWVKGYEPLSRHAGSVPKTQSAAYSLRQLAERGLISQDKANGMLFDTGLYDYHWHMFWGEDFETPDEQLEARI